MRGAAIAVALLFTGLGLALACAPRSARIPSLLVLLASLGACSLLPVSQNWTEGVYLACWVSVVATAACVYPVRGPGQSLPLALALNAGVWATAVVHLSGSRLDLLKALPCVLILFPAARIVGRGASIPLKVVSSWIIAVAVLAGALQLSPVTPGYLPDHLE